MKSDDMALRLLRRAAKLLKSKVAALRWLREPVQALGGATPLAYAQRPGGLRDVYAVL